MIQSVIIGTGSIIAESVIKNEVFLNSNFFQKDGTYISGDKQTIVDKFETITGISERRYATDNQNASDLGFEAALQAIQTAGIEKETLDCIIFAHNFGDVDYRTNRISQVPSLASRVKGKLEIKNPDCIAYDLLFGCPGWLQGVIHANMSIRLGDAKRCLIIGGETLSRVIDPHDRDSMIYSDGGGAVILEACENPDRGILACGSKTFAENANLISTGRSFSSTAGDQRSIYHKKKNIYLKMNGRKVYEFCLENVPNVICEVMRKAGITLDQVSKILIHQANEKMDNAILKRIQEMHPNLPVKEHVMPMTIHKLGNNSVATIPTLLDLMLKGQLEHHEIQSGNVVIMASVGAGMNINAIVYKF